MIRLRPSQIGLSARDVEEANQRLLQRRASRHAHPIMTTMRRPVNRDETLANGPDEIESLLACSLLPPLADDNGFPRTTQRPMVAGRTFSVPSRRSLDTVRCDDTAFPRGLVDDGPDGSGADQEYHRLYPDGHFGRQARDSLYGQLNYGVSGHDDIGQAEDSFQGLSCDEFFGPPGISGEGDFLDIERRFSEQLQLGGSPGASQPGPSYPFDQSSSPDDEVSPHVVPGPRLQLPHSSRQPRPRAAEPSEDGRRSRLPPSRLHISQAAASSSPEKGHTAQGPDHRDGLERRTRSSPLSRPFRGYPRRTGTRIRTSSLVESEVDDSSSADGWSEQAQAPMEDMDAGLTNPASSPPGRPGDYSSITHHTSPRNPAPILTSPRHLEAFTASTSTLSFDLTSSILDPSPRAPDTISPRSRYSAYRSRSPLPDSPPSSPDRINNHRTMRVYNDQLSPSTQPQTPSNRHTRPFNPAYTAPAAGGAGGGGSSGISRIFRFPPMGGRNRRWSRRQGRSGSLGRANPEGDDDDDQEQENVSALVEAERWERRVRNGIERRRRRWWELAGSGAMDIDGGDGLDTTPEREVQMGMGMSME